ncbi:MAG: hypothetical protein U0401_25110 [Anaerolineae bacterium]
MSGRDLLDHYGQAFLALSMHLADPQAKQIETLLADLTDAAISSATGAHRRVNGGLLRYEHRYPQYSHYCGGALSYPT